MTGVARAAGEAEKEGVQAAAGAGGEAEEEGSKAAEGAAGTARKAKAERAEETGTLHTCLLYMLQARSYCLRHNGHLA